MQTAVENQRFLMCLRFLSECFTDGLRRAWDKRGRFKELRSRGCDGPIEFGIEISRGA